MTIIDAGTGVEKNLSLLKKAVSALTTADKAWLAALEAFFEGIDPKTKDTTQGEINAKVKTLVPGASTVDQAVRQALDDVSFLQYTDKKLDARVSQSDPTSEELGRAVVEAEAYRLLTNEAFTNLLNFSQAIGVFKTTTGTDENFENFKQNLNKLFPPAKTARQDLSSDVDTLLKQSTGLTPVVTLPPAEPEGTDLLLGKKLSHCDLIFLENILPSTSKEFDETVTLLEGGHLRLSNNRIRKLINTWEKAVKNFVQAKTTADQVAENEFGSLDTIADFLCIHNVLDTLYDRLETRVTRTVEIISTDI